MAETKAKPKKPAFEQHYTWHLVEARKVKTLSLHDDKGKIAQSFSGEDPADLFKQAEDWYADNKPKP